MKKSRKKSSKQNYFFKGIKKIYVHFNVKLFVNNTEKCKKYKSYKIKKVFIAKLSERFHE